jgi:hypothetical protein
VRAREGARKGGSEGGREGECYIREETLKGREAHKRGKKEGGMGGQGGLRRTEEQTESQKDQFTKPAPRGLPPLYF